MLHAGGFGLRRRQVLAGIAGSVLFCRAIPADAAARAAALVEVAPGVFVHRGDHAPAYTPANRGDISNCGFVVGGECVAVIDTGGTAAFGNELLQAIRGVTPLPVRYVINTHMHPDHVLGNAAFRGDGTHFVGHHKLAAALSARADRYIAANKTAAGEDAFAGTEIVLPDMAVETTSSLDLGGRKLELVARRTAHTDNDLTVRDDATGTLFVGDLIFSGHVPALDGSIRGWIALLEELSASPAERIVPGHGPASMPWPAAAKPMLQYLQSIATDVRAAIAKGRSMSETMRTAAESERANWELFDEFHPRNVSAAFAELEWE